MARIGPSPVWPAATGADAKGRWEVTRKPRKTKPAMPPDGTWWEDGDCRWEVRRGKVLWIRCGRDPRPSANTVANLIRDFGPGNPPEPARKPREWTGHMRFGQTCDIIDLVGPLSRGVTKVRIVEVLE